MLRIRARGANAPVLMTTSERPQPPKGGFSARRLISIDDLTDADIRYLLKLAEYYAAGSAIKQPNTVEQVAAVAVMLARDEARNFTACLFPCDGGTMPY